jgi:hypothetical protein
MHGCVRFLEAAILCRSAQSSRSRPVSTRTLYRVARLSESIYAYHDQRGSATPVVRSDQIGPQQRTHA